MEAEETFYFNLLKSFLQYFTTSVLVSGIQDGGARWLAFWVILWALPLILDGYVMNDNWTIVKTKITCITYRASPCGLVTSAMFTQSAGIQHWHTTGIHRQQAYTGIQQAAIQHMLTHIAYSILHTAYSIQHTAIQQ